MKRALRLDFHTKLSFEHQRDWPKVSKVFFLTKEKVVGVYEDDLWFELDVDLGLTCWNGWKKEEFYDNGFWVATKDDKQEIQNRSKFIPSRVSFGKQEHCIINEQKPYIPPPKEHYQTMPEFELPNFKFDDRKKNRHRNHPDIQKPNPYPSTVIPKNDTTWTLIDEAISKLELQDTTQSLFEQKGSPLVLTQSLDRPSKPKIYRYNHLLKLYRRTYLFLDETDAYLQEKLECFMGFDLMISSNQLRTIFHEIRVLIEPDITFLCSDKKVFAHRKILEAG